MTDAFDFITKKEEDYFTNGYEDSIFIHVPTKKMAEWMDEYVGIRIGELGYLKTE